MSIENPKGGTEGENVDPHAEKRCTHVKPDGTRCKGWRAKGADLCPGHLNGFGRGGADPREAASRSAEVRREAAEDRSEAAAVARMGLQERTAAFLARDDVQRALEQRWLDILENGSDADAIRLHAQLADRVFGRPTERVEVDDVRVPASVEEIRAMSPEERRAALRELNARLARTGTED